MIRWIGIKLLWRSAVKLKFTFAIHKSNHSRTLKTPLESRGTDPTGSGHSQRQHVEELSSVRDGKTEEYKDEHVTWEPRGVLHWPLPHWSQSAPPCTSGTSAASFSLFTPPILPGDKKAAMPWLLAHTHTHTHRSPFLCSNRPRAGITQAWQTLTEADLGWNSRRGSVYPTACPFPLYIKPLQISQRVHHSAIGYDVTWKHMHLSWRWKGRFESGKSWF